MSEVDELVSKFGGITKSYKFYNGEVELVFDKEKHVYLLVNKDGSLEVQDGVTSICHIIDKSNALIPWGCKVMANKILSTVPIYLNEMGYTVIHSMQFSNFEKFINDAKSAHKEKLEEAGDIGHQAHAWIEHYIQCIIATNDNTTYGYNLPNDLKVKSCCEAALDWMQKHNVRWISTERKIYSKRYKYAGTSDGLCLCDSCDNKLCCPNAFSDRLSLVDWKSSNYLYIEYLFQTAAYQQAIEEEDEIEICDRWVIRLGKEDGKFEPWHLEREDFYLDWAGFKQCLYLSRSVRYVEERMADQKGKIKAANKAKLDKEKEEALKIKCKNADKYKGIKPPKCNGGNPCVACLLKYKENHDVVDPYFA